MSGWPAVGDVVHVDGVQGTVIDVAFDRDGVARIWLEGEYPGLPGHPAAHPDDVTILEAT